MKTIIKYTASIILFTPLIYILYLWATHAHLTQMQLLIAYWPRFILALAVIGLASWILGRDEY